MGNRGRRRDASTGQKLLGCVEGPAVRGVRRCGQSGYESH